MMLRQAVLASRDLDRTVADLCAVLGVDVAFRDPHIRAFGLRNAVMRIGSTFLEVVSPIEPGSAAGRFLDRRGGDGGYMIMLQTADHAAAARRVDELNVRVVLELDLDEMKELHLHPSDVPGAIVSISEPTPASAWKWGGPGWEQVRAGSVVDRVTGVELEARDPGALAARWANVLGLPTPREASDAVELALDGGRIRFVPLATLPREGIVAYELRATDRGRALEVAEQRGLAVERSGRHQAVAIAGTQLRFV
jgi:hypothetical protein